MKDNPDPIFETKFELEYFFEEIQTLKFDCWDYDSDGKHDFVGSCTMEVGEILHSQGILCITESVKSSISTLAFL